MLTPEERAAVEAVEQAEKYATPGPWKLWEGCSWRRFGSEATGNTVIEPTKHPRDGYPDLVVSKADADFVLTIRDQVRALLACIRRLEAELKRRPIMAVTYKPKANRRRGWMRNPFPGETVTYFRMEDVP